MHIYFDKYACMNDLFAVDAIFASSDTYLNKANIIVDLPEPVRPERGRCVSKRDNFDTNKEKGQARNAMSEKR